MSVFQDANLSNVKLRIGIMGMSFSGKTYTSLLLARGIVGEEGKIAVVDCEGGQVDIYKDLTPFKTMTLLPPYTPERYIECIEIAEKEGFDVIILDSISHEWAGEGGMLEAHDELEKASKNNMKSFSTWGEITPRHNAMFNAMLRSKIHVIATIRSKSATVIDVIDGKNVPVKIGLAPIQRDGMEYEFSILLEMDHSHAASVKKDRTKVLGDYGAILKPTFETGALLRDWMQGIVSTPEKQSDMVREKKPMKYYTEEETDMIRKTYEKNGWNTGVLTSAKLPDGLYDRSKIDADYMARSKM